ncbi:MAG: type II protein secretion system D protein [Nautiliaceae bacterium]
MKKILLLILGTFLFAGVCDKRLFNLHITQGVQLKSILSDLVNECQLNVVLKDNISSRLINKNIELINVKDVTLKELLNIIFQHANLFYEMKNNTIYVSYTKTKTFKVDFIPNTVTGISNIDSTDNSVVNNYKFDFWSDLQANIVQILRNVDENFKKPVIDKNSGLISVTGNRAQINEVAKYIKELNERLHKQVLIDVKIYTVTLSKSHQTGIDWSKLSVTLPTTSVPLRGTNILGKNTVFKNATFDISGFLNFLSQNGDVNSISNPKIVTLNNQKALISVGDTIYYKYASQVENNDNGNPTTTYTIDSKFVGVLLDITPQISDNGEIILSINPRISSFKDTSQLSNINRDMPPDTQENTMISVVKLKDNDTLVLGGLITDDRALKVNGVPVLKEIPLIKYLFSSKEKVTNKKELVFVITPHIINLDKKVRLKDYGFKKLPTLEELDVK